MEKPKKAPRKRTTTKKASPADAGTAVEAEAPVEEKPKKATRKRTTTKKPAAADTVEAPAEDS